MNTKIFFAAILIAASVCAQDMRSNANYSLFSDQKAAKPGDAITIIVMESSHASNNAETSSGRTSDIGLNFAGSFDKTKLPTGSMELATGNQFEGSGSTRTTGNVRTKISAMVDSVYANGNLRIKGSRKIVINGEEQIVRITGIVRPFDIGPDNSVLSYNISEAEIYFEGSGLIDDAQKPGWLTKFFHWLF